MSFSDQAKAQPTMPELLDALKRATDLNLRLMLQVQSQDALLHKLGHALGPVLVAHIAGDAAQTKTALDELLAKYAQHSADPMAPAAGLH